MTKIIIYSSSAGGTAVQKNTEAMNNLVNAYAKGIQKVVYLDVDAKDKDMVWSKGKKGVYPLLFVNDEFVGDFATVEGLNESELLQEHLKL